MNLADRPLSQRARDVLALLRKGPQCSYMLNQPLHTNYSPRAVGELKQWMALHPFYGTFVADYGCTLHKKCKRYRVLGPIAAAEQGQPMRAVTAAPSDV
jgi:hypothetical protein